MYKNAKQTLVNQPSGGFFEDEEIGEEVEDQAIAQIDPLDHLTHVTPQNFRKPLTAIIDIEVVGSPVELAENPQMTKWMLMPHVAKQLKQNLAMRDRHLAVGDQLAGNLKRVVPLGFRVIRDTNTFPYAMQVNIDGMLGRNLHRHGNGVWRTAANSPAMAVGLEVFDPANIANRYMLQNLKYSTPEDVINHDVTFTTPKGGNPVRARVAVNSLAYEVLADSLQHGFWDAEHIQDINIGHVLSPENDQHVEVTEKMGRDVIAHIKPILDASTAGFINAETWSAQVLRADGIKDFASAKNLVGDAVHSSHAAPTKISAELMGKRCQYHCKGELIFQIY